MSLDVYLTMDVPAETPDIKDRIFIRADGQTKEISREEWDRLHPDHEPVTFKSSANNHVYSENITHNLNAMASEAGIYDYLWRPDEIGITKASQLIKPLTEGLNTLKSDQERFEKFNPKNGWGNYKGFVGFVESYLSACKEYPEATVAVSR